MLTYHNIDIYIVAVCIKYLFLINNTSRYIRLNNLLLHTEDKNFYNDLKLSFEIKQQRKHTHIDKST